MKKLFLLACIAINCNLLYPQSPNWLWARTATGPTIGNGIYEVTATSVTTDNLGNEYVVGNFNTDSITFGNITLTNTTGSYNVFLVKYDSSGNAIWAKSAGGTSADYVCSVKTDGSGNVCIAGSFLSDSIKFGSVTLVNGTNFYYPFVVKYNAGGNVLWAKSAGGGAGEATYVTTDVAGNVYITGSFGGTWVTFGDTALANFGNNNTNIFLAKYDAAGNVRWAKRSSGISNLPYSVTTDGAGNVCVTGKSSGWPYTIFGGDTLNNAGIFVAKYDTSGKVLWANAALGGGPNDNPTSVTTDIVNNVYVAGYFQSYSLTFGPSIITNTTSSTFYDFFLVKYDALGNPLWARSAGGSLNDYGQSVSADASGSVYIGGYSHSPSIAFGSDTITNAGSYSDDIFLAKYDAGGNLIWARSAGDTTFGVLNSLVADHKGNLYTTGYFGTPTITGQHALKTEQFT